MPLEMVNNKVQSDLYSTYLGTLILSNPTLYLGYQKFMGEGYSTCGKIRNLKIHWEKCL